VIVIDSSVVIDAFLDNDILQRLVTLFSSDEIIVPDHFDIECISAFRRMDRNEVIQDVTIDGLIASLRELKCVRCSVQPFLKEIWALRNNFSAYDAAYVVLAFDTASTFITHDKRLANAAASIVRVKRLDT
jgi:predicted nucleic acid-binding protein